jgi:uncharacterized protein (UPF0262 family)
MTPFAAIVSTLFKFCPSLHQYYHAVTKADSPADAAKAVDSNIDGSHGDGRCCLRSALSCDV